MTRALHDGGMTVIEIEPDPKAIGALRKLMEDFTARAPAAPAEDLRNRTFFTTMNATQDDDKVRNTGFLPPAMLERFTAVMMQPPGDEVMEKLTDMVIAKTLAKENLSPRQQAAAEKFLKQKGPDAEDKSTGARGIHKRIKKSFDSAAFKKLMRETSSAWTLSEMSQAIKGGSTEQLHAPATARFKRGRKP